MGIAKSLTNDLERALRLYRLPILTAIALSLRQLAEDRFLLTDDRSEDDRRNVFKLRRVSKVEQKTCEPGIGVDDRQFTAMTNMLAFTGLPDANGIVQPIGNLTNLGGRADLEDVLWSSSGTAEQKQEKIRRYSNRRPGDVSWRVRTPIMMADATSIIDYLALRCTQLPFLHSVAMKWSDRRWDGSTIGIDEDMFRPTNERSHMIVLPPMWMDQNRRVLDPNIWGPYQPIIQANYQEYMGRKMDEWLADCSAFVQTYQEYIKTVSGGFEPGRVERLIDTNFNKTLHVPFNRNIRGDGNGNDTYALTSFDPAGGQDVTQDIFNLQDASNAFRLTSSFEGASLSEDGFCGTAVTAYVADVPTGLPPFAKDRSGSDVFGTKSLEVSDGFVARRMVLPDGKYTLSCWVKAGTATGRIELIRNSRLHQKGQTMSGDRETSATHFRESYETLVTSAIRSDVPGWRKVWLSFSLVDHFKVDTEPYPKHEVFIVLEAEGAIRFDHLELFQDYQSHVLRIFNTVNRSTLPYTVRPELRHVDLEAAFHPDIPFGVREQAGAFFRFDGANTACELESRDGYNLKETGSTINAWFKINSAEEAKHRILSTRGGFTIFQKTGINVQGYSCSLDYLKLLSITFNNKTLGNSKDFHNNFLQPSIGSDAVPHRLDWTDPNQWDSYVQAFTATGKQPVEWIDYRPASGAYVAWADGTKTDVGGGKTLIITPDDPYLATGDGFFIGGGSGSLPDGTPVTFPAGKAVSLPAYLDWHARKAYAMVVPLTDVNPGGDSTGFMFLPIPINTKLNAIGANIGGYSPSPAGWEASHSSPSPGLQWPISPDIYGSPVLWPGSPYGTPPEWKPFAWGQLFTYTDMVKRYPLFLAGELSFDRWWNLDIAVDSAGWRIAISGAVVKTGTDISFPTGSNSDRLLIGNDAPEAINGGSPISVYSFKIFQRKNTLEDLLSIVNGENTNFNDIQYNVYADALDVDGDHQLDFWQDDFTDFGLWVIKATGAPQVENQYGKVVISANDPITLRTDYDRDRTTIADWYDGPYLQELIDIQVAGFGDGILLWDFAQQEQDSYHGYSDRVWDPTCRRYVPRFLSYYDWLQGVLNEEWNTITSIHDPIPTQANSGPPVPDPSPFYSPLPANSPANAFGVNDGQLVMTGVKGWFGYNALLGYRDSLELLRKEGMIFNYLQIEFRFQAPREELEALLANYAKSYSQILNDDYVGNRLTRKSPR